VRKEHPVGALVVGGDHPGLGVARSLGRRGIPVYVLEDQHSVSSFSRYVQKVIKTTNLRDETATVEALLQAGKEFNLNGWVLYPTRDETVVAVARHREALSKIFRVTTPDWETIQWAWDKNKTWQLAEQIGVPSPQTWNVRNEEELEPLFSRLPLAVKPAIKENFFYATGAKAWRANTPEELRQYYRKAAAQISTDEIMLQEIIPGDGSKQFSYCAFAIAGKAHSVLIARRDRQHPREFGRAATYVETVDVPALEALAERFLCAIRYYGLVEMEFKLDDRDQRYKLLDVNARAWGFHSIGPAAGVDFCYMLYADQMGEKVEPVRARSGVGWLRLVTDIPTAASQMLGGYLPISSYWRSLRNTRIESVFAKEDPMPSVGEFALLPYLVFKKYLSKR